MKNNSIRSVVATGIGAALFVVIGMISIPTPVPNTSIQLQYALQALFSVIFGPVVGFLTGFIGHALKDIVSFNVIQLLANAVVWIVIAPLGDILIYNEPANKVFVQGVVATISNGLTVAIAGTVLLLAYARTQTKSGSLKKD